MKINLGGILERVLLGIVNRAVLHPRGVELVPTAANDSSNVLTSAAAESAGITVARIPFIVQVKP